jgi:hypothetical protein
VPTGTGETRAVLVRTSVDVPSFELVSEETAKTEVAIEGTARIVVALEEAAATEVFADDKLIDTADLACREDNVEEILRAEPALISVELATSLVADRDMVDIDLDEVTRDDLAVTVANVEEIAFVETRFMLLVN